MNVYGFCPMGCGETLFLDEGHVKCVSMKCPRDTAVDELLADQETGHIVELTSRDFSMIHPLRERLNKELLQCELNDFISDCSGPPMEPGRYRVTGGGIEWRWQYLT